MALGTKEERRLGSEDRVKFKSGVSRTLVNTVDEMTGREFVLALGAFLFFFMRILNIKI